MAMVPRRPDVIDRRGLTLIETLVASIVLVVAATGFARIYRAQSSQREAQEDVAVALELLARQIEHLRLADHVAPYNRDPYNAGAALGPNNQFGPPPFTEDSFDALGNCANADGGAGPGTHDLPRLPLQDFLHDLNSFRFPDNERWLVRPNRAPWTAPANANVLVMPQDLTQRGYYVIVHAARVTTEAHENLIHYQISVMKDLLMDGATADDRLILMQPYILAVGAEP